MAVKREAYFRKMKRASVMCRKNSVCSGDLPKNAGGAPHCEENSCQMSQVVVKGHMLIFDYFGKMTRQCRNALMFNYFMKVVFVPAISKNGGDARRWEENSCYISQMDVKREKLIFQCLFKVIVFKCMCSFAHKWHTKGT